MASRRTTKRKPAARRRTTPRATAKRRRTTRKSKNRTANILVPLFLMSCIVIGLTVLIVAGYRTISASSFFDLEEIIVTGNQRTTSKLIENIVRDSSTGKGVWNTDITEVKNEIEKIRFVRRASVSRVLPNRLRISIDERVPVAIVRLRGKNYWVDDEGMILNRIGNSKKRKAFAMYGWDEGKTDAAIEQNQERLRVYTQLREEWKVNDMASRVRAVDLSDPNQPRAIVSDSGKTVTIVIAQEDYVDSLRMGIESVAGRGVEVEKVIVTGGRPVIKYRNS